MKDTCILTKRKFNKSFELFQDVNFNGYKYYFKPVGKVFISTAAEIVINNIDKINLTTLISLCRCAHELNEEPPIIDSRFLNSLDSLKNIPKTFKEKYNHFLSLLFKTGGNEYKSRTIEVEDDYPLAFASDIPEFQRIIDFALSSGELECINKIETEEQGAIIYIDLRFTPKGMSKMDKLLNNYFSIIQPTINSGSPEIDRKINHAISLFSQENSSMEDKRSACEELSYLIEPFRKEMQKYFIDKDINLFFQLVNEFDIRHNKEHTKKIIYEEQLEWIFQCLLNSLFTFIKIRTRFK